MLRILNQNQIGDQMSSINLKHYVDQETLEEASRMYFANGYSIGDVHQGHLTTEHYETLAVATLEQVKLIAPRWWARATPYSRYRWANHLLDALMYKGEWSLPKHEMMLKVMRGLGSMALAAPYDFHGELAELIRECFPEEWAQCEHPIPFILCATAKFAEETEMLNQEVEFSEDNKCPLPASVAQSLSYTK
jgi:hypothetical protein